MDSRRVQIGQEPLPNEIWAMILDCVEENSDLLACRQVNRLWYSITTPICRHSFLRLNLYGVFENALINLNTFCSVFQHCNNLPWSACELVLDPPNRMNNPSIFSDKLRIFIHLFGSHIHELTLSGGNVESSVKESLLFIMNRVPNIEYLDISRINLPRATKDFPMQLGKLKGLIASISNVPTFRFFELLLNRTKVQLRSLQLKIIPGDWLVEKCEVLSTLITGIPTLHLELHKIVPELFIQLTKRRVQVHALQIHLNALSFAIPYFYSSLEAFLKNTADSLKNLSLNDNQLKHQRENSRLTIPILPKLTQLELNAGMLMGSPLFTNVTPFTSAQFPMLAKVLVQVHSRFGHGTLFNLGPFHTVTKLVLKDKDALLPDPSQTDWGSIFPNLKELEAEIGSSELQLILNKFKSLERLSLSVPRVCLHEYSENGSIIITRWRQFGNGIRGGSGTASLLSLERKVDPVNYIGIIDC